MISKSFIGRPSHQQLTACLLVIAVETALAAITRADALPIEPGSWTLAILPDTQIYAQSYPQHYNAQTQWIRDHAESHNIKYVLHEGDITNNNNSAQWNNALASMNLLNGAVPYAMAPGNHDYGPNGNAAERDSLFNTAAYFGPGTYYASQPSVGGFFEATKTDNSYHTFSAGGEEWLVLALEWGPRDEVVDWANQIVSAHPDHKAMLVTHAYMYYDETIYDWATKGSSQSWNPNAYPLANLPENTINDGQQLWNKLVSQHENFQFVFNGHVLGDGTGFRSTLGDDGNVVHQMLSNYQFKSQGGMGDMRLLEFKADGKTVEVRTYSPVLDRYDTSYDQQFTLTRDELHAPLVPPAPPRLEHVVAANLIAIGPTDPSTNTVNDVQVAQSSQPAVSLLQVNRGDYQVAIDGDGLRYQHGVLLASITEHDRPDFVNRRASVEVGRSSFSDGLLSLSVMEGGNASNNEVNFNTAVAWFQFATGWQGAHINGSGTVAPGAANRVDQSMVTRTAAGRYRVDLGVDSRSDGLLFAVGNNNDNIVVQTGPFADGNGWDIRVEDNATNFGATGEDRDFSFVYLPYDTPRLVGGLYDGLGATSASSVGEFSLSRLDTGQYELVVPGESPETGMLVMSVAYRATSAGVTAPDDNLLSYEASPTGSFLINSYDLSNLNFQDTKFAWAFISFENPLTPALIVGDYDRDGEVDHDDYLVWKEQFGTTGASPADGNGDGAVDSADYTIWRDALGENASASVTNSPLPEPATIQLFLLAILSTTAMARSSRRRIAAAVRFPYADALRLISYSRR